jgi:hypothetical protein
MLSRPGANLAGLRERPPLRGWQGALGTPEVPGGSSGLTRASRPMLLARRSSPRSRCRIAKRLSRKVGPSGAFHRIHACRRTSLRVGVGKGFCCRRT